MNPFLTIHGPRPETWWAVCNLCGQTSSPRFRSEADAGDWEHDCHTEADDDGKVTLTVEFTLDDPPEISWKGQLKRRRFKEIRAALLAMDLFHGQPPQWRSHPTWNDAVRDDWTSRRQAAADRVIAEFERSIELPYVCPECTQRCKTVGGLKNHMRACWKVDPFKFKRGGYDAAMVPRRRPDIGRRVVIHSDPDDADTITRGQWLALGAAEDRSGTGARSDSRSGSQGVSTSADDTLTALLGRPDWHKQAACRGMATVMFFVGRGETSPEAEAACDRCPVRADCLAHALAQPELHGRWGGLSERARRRIRNRRRVDAADAQRKAAS